MAYRCKPQIHYRDTQSVTLKAYRLNINSQLISLWKVADNATKDLMINYYQRLLDPTAKIRRSEALRQTQLEMLRGEEYQHPYYWAAFIPSGDWQNMEE